MANPFSQTTRSLHGDKSSIGALLWLLALVLFAAWSAWFLLVPVTVYEVSKTARVEVEQAVHPITAQTNGKVLATTMQLNKTVNKGDILLELDARSEQLALAEEEARLQAIPPQLTSIERQIADEEQAAERLAAAAANAISAARQRHQEALSAAEFAKEHSQRINVLQATGRVAQIDALRSRADADKTQSMAEALSFEIDRINADSLGKAREKQAAVEALRRESAALRGQLALSTASVERLKQGIDKHLIRASISGKIGEAAPFETGSYVESGNVVGRIVPTGNLKVVADFSPGRSLGRIRPQQVGRMRLDGFPWAQYGVINVQVDRVASEVREGNLRVELVPDSQLDSKLLLEHGLPGSVEIEIERVTPAVLTVRAAGQWLSRPVRQTRY